MSEPPEDVRFDYKGDGYDPEPLLDYKEVAEILGLSNTNRVYELPIPRVRIGSRTFRWRPADVRAYIQGRVEEP